MDYDGANVKWLTDDLALVLKPRFSPDGRGCLYTSYASGFPQAMVMDVNSLSLRQLGGAQQGTMSFSPRFSPDGRWIVYSLEAGRQYRHLPDGRLVRGAAGADQRALDRDLAQLQPGRAPDRL